MTEAYTHQATELLSQLIAIPSISREETAAADYLETWMQKTGLSPHREANNLWCVAPGYDASRPTLLLNAHIDTVRPVPTWTRLPHVAQTEGDRLYGLGSNDSNSLAELYHACGGKVATVALHADTLLAFAGEHRTDFDALDGRVLDGLGLGFGNLLAGGNDKVASSRMNDIVNGNTSKDALRE